MSSDIWTQCAAESSVGLISFRGFRSVENQFASSTYKLVDSPEEHAVLENILEENKPGAHSVDGVEGLHYLLFTPFRYPPLRHGSRFGAAGERGIFYASLKPATALAETTYYRYLFAEQSMADLFPLSFNVVVFPVPVSTEKGLDLTGSTFENATSALADPSSYDDTQRLGRRMREAGIEAFLFPSARCPQRRTNAGIFSPRAFTRRTVPTGEQQTWSAVINESTAFFRRGHGAGSKELSFTRSQFLVNDQLPRVGV